MGKPFPRTQVGGVSLPRMIIGCNWISGFSHTSSSCDNMIKSTHSCPETTAKIFEKFLDADIDAVLGLFGVDTKLRKAVDIAQENTGKKMIIIDEPILNMDDTPWRGMKRSLRSRNVRRAARHSACRSTPVWSSLLTRIRGRSTVCRII